MNHIPRVALKTPPFILEVKQNLVGGGASFDSSYQAILDYATLQGFTLPSSLNQILQNTFLVSLKNNGIWDKLDVFYNFLTDGDANFAKINWKNPGTFQAVGTPTFTANFGFKGDGVAQYLDTQFDYRAGTGNYLKESASFFMDVVQAGTINNAQFHGWADGGGYLSSLVEDGNGTIINAQIYVNYVQFTAASPTVPAFLHLSTLRVSKNGEQIATAQRLPNWGPTPVSQSLYILAQNANPNVPFNFTDGAVSCFGAGATLDGLEAALYGAWNTYKNFTIASAAYKAITDYATSQGFTLPSNAQRVLQLRLLYALVKDGIWDKLDVFYNFFTDGDANFAKINWKAPGTFQAVGTGHEPTFTTNSGFKGNGTTMYLNTAHSAGPNFTQTDAAFFLDVLRDTSNTSLEEVGTYDGISLTILNSFVGSGFLSGYLNFGDFAAANAPGVSGLIHVRNQAGGVVVFRNGIEGEAVGTVQLAPSTEPYYLLARNQQGVPIQFSDALISCFGSSASLTGLELALFNAWTTYKNEVSPPVLGYDAVIAYATAQGFTLPSANQQTAQRALVDLLIAEGIWDKLDVFYNFLTDGSSDFAKINWKAPGTFQAVGTGHEPTFTANSGFKGDGISQYLDTQWNPFINAVTFKNNEAGLIVEHTEDIDDLNNYCGVTNLPDYIFSYFPKTTQTLFYLSNSGVGIDNVSPKGFMHGNLVGTTQKVFKNGLEIGTAPANVLNVFANLNWPCLVLAFNQAGTPSGFSSNGVSVFALGASLAGLESALYGAWENYKTTARSL